LTPELHYCGDRCDERSCDLARLPETFMRRFLLLFLLGASSALAQTADSTRSDVELSREANRWALVFGPVFGVGGNVAIGENFRLEGRTYLLRGTLEASYYLFDENASPYVGLGAGLDVGLFTGDSTGNALSWSQIHVGYEYAWRRWFLQANVGWMLARICGAACNDIIVGNLVGDVVVGVRLF
jgi:hypothetical protein